MAKSIRRRSRNHNNKISSLCNLCVLCVSVVNNRPGNHHRDTENTEVAQRNSDQGEEDVLFQRTNSESDRAALVDVANSSSGARLVAVGWSTPQFYLRDKGSGAKLARHRTAAAVAKRAGRRLL